MVTIEDILADLGISLKGNRCRCPLHGGENRTSFSVNNGFFHCFSCGESGDLIALTQKLYNMGFKEALHYLANRVGLSSEKNVITKRKGTRQLSQRILEKDSEKSIEDTLIFLEKSYIQVLKKLDQDLKDRKITLSKYYARQQWIEHKLEELDELGIKMNFEKKMRRKEKWKKVC